MTPKSADRDVGAKVQKKKMDEFTDFALISCLLTLASSPRQLVNSFIDIGSTTKWGSPK